MRVYAISNIPGNPRGARGFHASWPYYQYFHGNMTAMPSSNRYGKRPYPSRGLVRNVRIMPAAFFSSISFVVREEVAQRLSAFAGVDLSPCHWAEIYDLPVDEGAVQDVMRRFSIFSDDFGEWLEEQRSPPPAGWRGPAYWEVIVPTQTKLLEAFDCRSTCVLPDPLYEKMAPLVTSAALHRQYPVTKLTPYVLCTEETYAVLEPHVADRDLFGVTVCEVE